MPCMYTKEGNELVIRQLGIHHASPRDSFTLYAVLELW
jgi:hypothetical protein